MKSTDVLSPRQRDLWKMIRFLVPPKARWYYEGHPALRGQLWYAERRLLYRTIRQYRPATCFEIGTWRGGGSTLFISQALHDNGAGLLHTIEIDRTFYEEARENYRRYLPHLQNHVAFHVGDFREVYGDILRNSGGVSFLLLDGAEQAEETVRQYDFFRPHLTSGSILMAHDWFTEKARLLRPLIEQSKEWDVRAVLGPPASVGFAVAERR